MSVYKDMRCNDKEERASTIATGCINYILGVLGARYCMWYLLGKSVPWLACMLISIFSAQYLVAGMIVIWILRMFGIDVRLV